MKPGGRNAPSTAKVQLPMVNRQYHLKSNLLFWALLLLFAHVVTIKQYGGQNLCNDKIHRKWRCKIFRLACYGTEKGK
jgi:hypothetical protein